MSPDSIHPTQGTLTDDDLAWDIASAIQVQPADGATHPQEVGSVLARSNPTGWFVSARHRQSLGHDEVEHFENFVTTRVYMLLTQGPRPGTWTRTGPSSWRAVSCAHPDLQPVPATVPANWS